MNDSLPTTARHVLMTGSTGIVGSHLLYELLLERLQGEVSGHMYLVVRGLARVGTTARERVVKVLSSDHAPAFLRPYSVEEMFQHITVISMDFTVDDLSSLKDIVKQEVYVIHAAASTNLAHGSEAEKEHAKVNFQGSLRLLEACKDFARRYTFVSTAYSCGKQTGIIPADFSGLSPYSFRNPYEANKWRTEQQLEVRCRDYGIGFQVLRPGVVIARLLEEPLYYLPKYNVIFAFAAFFFGLRQKGIVEDMAVEMHDEATMHLVPVDYVAKAISKLYADEAVTYCNILPSEGYLVKPLIDIIMQEVGYSHYYYGKGSDVAQSRITQVYNSKVAASFGPYIADAPYTYDTSVLESKMQEIGHGDVLTHFRAMMSEAVRLGF